jgi:hypothetical protein
MRKLYSLLAFTAFFFCLVQKNAAQVNDDFLQVLMLDVSTYDAFYSEQIQTTLTQIDPQVVVTSFNDGTQDLESSLYGKDIVIVAYPHKGGATRLRKYGTVIQQFAQRGGVVIFTGTHDISKLNLFNLLHCDRGSYNPAPQVRLTQHDAFTQNLPDQFTSANFTYPIVVSDQNYVSLAVDSERTVFGYKKFGAGMIFYVGLEFYHMESVNKVILENILSFARTNKLALFSQHVIAEKQPVQPDLRSLPITFEAQVDWRVFPNPYVSRTQAEFTVQQTSRVDLAIVDETGVVKQRLIQNAIYEPGQYALEVADLPHGTYFVQLSIGRQKSVKKIVRIQAP